MKMGAGTNVQQRLVALHHLDAPWRPADVEQREGRILRQGNTNPEVQIYRYVTEASFDAYMWQTLETKAKFISQVMTGESDLRRIEDVDGTALTYAEVKAIASGNPLVIEKAKVDTEVARLSRLETQHTETHFKLRQRIRTLTEELPRLVTRLEAVRHDLTIRQDTRGDLFSIVIEGQTIRDRGIAGELINRRAERVRGARVELPIGNFAGFQLLVADNFMRGPEILLKGRALHTANRSDSALGTIRSVEHIVQNLEENVARLEQQIADTRKRITDSAAQYGQPFEYTDKLAELIRRQQEITESLDLTKNQASSQLATEAHAPSGDENTTSLREIGFYEYD